MLQILYEERTATAVMERPKDLGEFLMYHASECVYDIADKVSGLVEVMQEYMPQGLTYGIMNEVLDIVCLKGSKCGKKNKSLNGKNNNESKGKKRGGKGNRKKKKQQEKERKKAERLAKMKNPSGKSNYATKDTKDFWKEHSRPSYPSFSSSSSRTTSSSRFSSRDDDDDDDDSWSLFRW